MPSTPQSVPTVVLFDYLLNDAGAALSGERVIVTLNAPSPITTISPLTVLTTTQQQTTTDGNGYWSVSLVPNTNISPANTVYQVQTPAGTYDVTLGSVGPYQSTAVGTIVNVPVPLQPAMAGTVQVGGLLVTAGEPGIDTIAAGALLIADNTATSVEAGSGATPFALQGDVATRSLTVLPTGPYTPDFPAGATNILASGTSSSLYDKGGAVINVAGPKYRAIGTWDPVAGTGDATAAFNQAATDAGTGIVFGPAGTYILNVWALSGLACVFQGVGDGTVLKAKAGIAGAVLDLTGYTSPANFNAKREFGNFRILGANVADATLAQSGLKLGANCYGLVFRNIGITLTGGPALDISSTALINDFIDCVLGQPVSANANNVPYLRMRGANNGNRFIGCGFRSISTAADPLGGIVSLATDGASLPTSNTFESCWVEFAHVPTNGTIFFCGGNDNVFSNTQFFDSVIFPAATGTSYFYMNAGANIIRGVIPGCQGGSTIQMGVVLNSSGNHVDGIKGASTVANSNVQINNTFGYNFCLLGGNELASNIAAFTDNSAVTTNVLIDTAASGQFHIVAGLLQADKGLTVAGTSTLNGLLALNTVSGGSASLALTDTSATAGFHLVNSGGGKYIRAQNTTLDVLNGAGLAIIFSMDDTGHLFLGSGAAPGTSGLVANLTSATFTGNDIRGTIALVVAAGGIAAGSSLFTATFAASYGATAPKILVVDETSNAIAGFVGFYIVSQSTGVSFVLGNSQALVVGTYTVGYIVIG